MSAMVYREAAPPGPPVCCPACRGVTGFVERHQPWGSSSGPTYDFVTTCSLCGDAGLVGRAVAQGWWRWHGPSA